MSVYPQTTLAENSIAGAVSIWEAPGAYLAGLAVTLPTVSSEALKTIGGLQAELGKALEKVELPTAPAVGAGFSIGDRELPWPTLIFFAAGGVMLVALFVFGGALLKMSLEESRKGRRLRRRYAP